MRPAISSSDFEPRARFMRRSEPNWLMNIFWPGCPLIFSNSSAGPPGPRPFFAPHLETRSVISVTSRIGSTSAVMRFNSPALSSAAIHSRKSSYATGTPQNKWQEQAIIKGRDGNESNQAASLSVCGIPVVKKRGGEAACELLAFLDALGYHRGDFASSFTRGLAHAAGLFAFGAGLRFRSPENLLADEAEFVCSGGQM